MAWEKEERGAWRTPAEASWHEVRKEVWKGRKERGIGIEIGNGTGTGREVIETKIETGIEKGGETGTGTASTSETGVIESEGNAGRTDTPLCCPLLEIMKDWVTEAKKGKTPSHHSLKKALRTGWA